MWLRHGGLPPGVGAMLVQTGLTQQPDQPDLA
jgi:hypothetical protein